MKEYIRVYCCGDCIYYDWKKHKCKRGAKEEGKAQDAFYRDCPERIYLEIEEEVKEANDERTD